MISIIKEEKFIQKKQQHKMNLCFIKYWKFTKDNDIKTKR